MNRWLLMLLAVIGGAIGAYFAVLFLGGALIGVLWLFVLGDHPWPQGWERAMEAALIVVGLLLWAYFASAIWSRFKPAQ